MDKPLDQLRRLIDQGSQFTYDNFSEKDVYDYPIAYKSDWVEWTTQSRNTIINLFGKGSVQDKAMIAALKIHVLGNNEDKFQGCQGYILNVLRDTVEALPESAMEEQNKEGKFRQD